MRETIKDMLSDVDYVGKPKRVANNTLRYERADGATVWRLHHTDIVVKNPEGVFTLNTGGWRTVTTKDRINTYAPCHIASHNGIWYVSGVPFVDGIRLDANGAPLDPPQTDKVTEVKALKRKVSRFLKCVDATDELPVPDNGDCWCCSMFDREASRDASEPQGWRGEDLVKGPADKGNPDHLLSHMDEGYLHGSLLVNAMRYVGYTDQNIRMHYSLNIRDTFKRALRRYLYARLGVAN